MSQGSGSVYLVGTGRLASHLGPVLKRADLLAGVRSRNPDYAEKLATELNVPVFEPDALNENDLVICAVSDDALPEVLTTYSKFCFAVSLSGNFDALSLNSDRIGVMYPLQTFAPSTEVEWTKIPLLIEAEGDLETRLLDLSNKISSHVKFLSATERRTVHLAAVWVNNFTTYMVAHAKQIMSDSNLDFSILHPLLQQTIQNILSKEELFDLVTGPARRKDVETIRAHEKLLVPGSQLELYQLLTKSILKNYD